MRRREFITLLSGAAASWPLAARAQQAAKMPSIGYLGVTTPAVSAQRLGAFQQRLRELGWIDGRNIVIEYRWTEGSNERAAEFATEFVRRNVDVIVTGGAPAVAAAKQATSVIPIVFQVVNDPVSIGLVESLARPGGNVTGLSNQSAELAGKRLELLREIVSGLRRLAIIANAENPDASTDLGQSEAAARALGLDITILRIRSARDIIPAFATVKDRVQAVYAVADPLVNTNRARIHTLAMAAHLPSVYNAREFVEAGGLMSYGPNASDLFRRSAEFVDKILRGAKPADIPVEQPSKFDLVVNLTTANALGLTIPESFLLRADEVIE
jgi:putative tryptophan/tyrosine transport system substrate-binding protein